MKYLKQFLIILAISFIGEILKYIVPLPIPASIYGMVIMFICLQTKILKLDDVKSVGKFLIAVSYTHLCSSPLHFQESCSMKS